MKLQVNVSDELVKQIDDYANMMGISRSSLCAVFIGQGIMAYNKSYSLIDEVREQLKYGMCKSISDISADVSDEVSEGSNGGK